MSGWRRFVVLAAMLALGCTAAALRAADDETVIVPRRSASAESPISGSHSGSGVATLLGVIGLAAAGGWVFWRGRKTKGLGREARQLVIEETRPLGNRQFLVVAAYRGQKFLVGVCPGRIELVAPLSTTAEERVNA